MLGDLRPDRTLVFDLPPELGLARAHSRGDANRFEAEAMAFQQRVRQAYLDRARAAPERYTVIDASQELLNVQSQLQAALEPYL